MAHPDNSETIPTAITVREFRQAVPLPRSTVYRFLREKKIRSVRIGRRILIPRQVVIELLTPEGA